MSGWRFVEFWCAGYGLLWAILLVAALVSQSNIDAGEFGLIGFPILALLYAFIRWNGESARHRRGRSTAHELDRLARELDALKRRMGS